MPTAGAGGPPSLTAEQRATLESLQQLDPYPLYTMTYRGAYITELPSNAPVAVPGDWAIRASAAGSPAPEVFAPSPVGGTRGWACSLFAALGDPEAMLYGRNFDWGQSPALLLLTDPPDGYASVSMVDIAYLGFVGERAGVLLDLPLEERVPLLYAPIIPFDGMNEAGLAVGMAAVPGAALPPEPSKPAMDSIGVIREMLDHAADVGEAVAILGQYSIDWGSGPPIHYLLADRTGKAVLAEFSAGELVTFANESPWHLATNFLRVVVGDSVAGQCWRYDRIALRLARTDGRLTVAEAMDLLSSVSQDNTQWSVVYGLSTGQVVVSMGRQYDRVHTLQALEMRR